jgi:hypothetical protein
MFKLSYFLLFIHIYIFKKKSKYVSCAYHNTWTFVNSNGIKNKLPLYEKCKQDINEGKDSAFVLEYTG